MESPATAEEADDSCRARRERVGSHSPSFRSKLCGSGRGAGCVMTGVWALAALWLGLALIASLLSIWFRISTALSDTGSIAD
jgi:hypothetical protein